MAAYFSAMLAGLFFLALSGNFHGAGAAGPLLIAYGGYNETMAPIWVGIEKGLFNFPVV